MKLNCSHLSAKNKHNNMNGCAKITSTTQMTIMHYIYVYPKLFLLHLFDSQVNLQLVLHFISIEHM